MGAEPQQRMEKSMAKEYIAAIDGGTTNTRIYLMRRDGTLADRIGSETGVRNTAIDGSNEALKNAVRSMLQDLLQRNRLSWEDLEAVYASGMITSNLGLYELAHVIAPTSLKEIAGGCRAVCMEEVCPLPIHFIPGVKNVRDAEVCLENVSEMDMMRGEETEVLGLAARHDLAAGTIVVLPGSHTKIIGIGEGGAIEGCVTSMTGELLQVMTQYSIVGDAVANRFADRPDPAFLLAGYRAARDSQSFGRAAFVTRICSQFVCGEPDKCAAFLLGAVLENDIAAMRSSSFLKRLGARDVVIAGKEPLAGSLRYLLEADSVYENVRILDNDGKAPMAAEGALAIHRFRTAERRSLAGAQTNEQGEKDMSTENTGKEMVNRESDFRAESVMEAIRQYKIVAIVRGVQCEKMLPLADALYEGGIRLMEVTFDQRSEAGKQETLSSIELLSQKRGERMWIGAGTVLSAEQVAAAHEAGAGYIITPNINAEVIEKAHELGMPIMCGAFTPTEIEYAYRLGADIVKVFPASLAGLDYIKAVRGPLAHIPMSAVGGVNVDNIADFYCAGTASFGIGGNLVDKTAIDREDYAAITRKAAAYVEALQRAEAE